MYIIVTTKHETMRSEYLVIYYKTLSYRIGVDREIPPEGSLNQVKPEACRGFYLI